MTNLIVFLSFFLSTNWGPNINIEDLAIDEKISRVSPKGNLESEIPYTPIYVGTIHSNIVLTIIWKDEKKSILLESVKIKEIFSSKPEYGNTNKIRISK